MPKNLFVINLLPTNKHIFVDTYMNSTELTLYIERYITESLSRGNQEIRFFNTTIRLEDVISDEFLEEVKNCKSYDAYKKKIKNLQESFLYSFNILSMEDFLNNCVYHIGPNVEDKIIKGLSDRMFAADINTPKESFEVVEDLYKQIQKAGI